MKGKNRRSGIYLLPNLFTTGSLFAAFYSIVASMQARFEVGAIAIFVGMVADGLDGRVARMTNTQTAFGAEYDSLSDMVTFGVAPAILFYSWTLHSLGKVGWLVAFIYTAAVALRLARFNTQLETADKRYFQGLSCTLAGALMASFAWFCSQNDWNNGSFIAIISAVLTIICSLLMVSNIRYNSFKEIDGKGRIPFIYVLGIVLLFVAIAANPSLVLLIAAFAYAASGPVKTLFAVQRVRKRRQAIKKSIKLKNSQK
ncbi:MAG: CDP-diacylglycerol--serine O-phosphatidyltransferase [Legionellales bacterium RIFCSPHIGHO2_12_FULL_35_11]|nr:MAG: CDP-diacylglycerol--serine O-phosphatidyltransferase [Legionellales bacterium RIFCSPHIGHO2_12_FULL_35_11]